MVLVWLMHLPCVEPPLGHVHPVETCHDVVIAAADRQREGDWVTTVPDAFPLPVTSTSHIRTAPGASPLAIAGEVRGDTVISSVAAVVPQAAVATASPSRPITVAWPASAAGARVPAPAPLNVTAIPRDLPTSTLSPLPLSGPASLAPQPQLPPLHVLVVDDDATIRRLHARMLSRMGCSVTTAADGDEVGPALAAAAMAAAPIEVVVLDILMPRMPGDEACRRLRAGGDNATPVVAATGNVAPGEEARYLALGFDAVVLKPATATQLGAAIVGALAHRLLTFH